MTAPRRCCDKGAQRAACFCMPPFVMPAGGMGGGYRGVILRGGSGEESHAGNMAAACKKGWSSGAR